MEPIEIRGNKTSNDLLWEAAWFTTHSAVAICTLLLLVGLFSIAGAEQDSTVPKLLATALAFLVPLLAGLLAARLHPDNVAPYVWIGGLLMFLVVSVYVLDLPTGNGLCNDCGPADKLWRTFFSIDHNSGLMGGDGLLVGTWMPLSMVGYAVGAKVGRSLD